MSRVLMTTGLLSLCCAASLSAATVSSADPGVPFHDVLVGVAAVAAPDITEHQTPAGGVTTDYEWNDNPDYGYRVTVTSLNGRAYRWGGFVWGAELALSSFKTTPTTFTSNGTKSGNVDGSELSYRQAGINVIAGYEYGITKKDGLRAYVEVLPHIGGGLAWADSDLGSSTSGAPPVDHQKGRGRYFEYGLSVGGFVTERNWLYGITLGVIRSSALVDIPFDGYDDQLVLKSFGLDAGFHVGYRF